MMNPRDGRQNDNKASDVGEAFSLSPRERTGVRGKRRSANQRAGELLMDSTTLSEGKQRPTPGEAPSP